VLLGIDRESFQWQLVNYWTHFLAFVEVKAFANSKIRKDCCKTFGIQILQMVEPLGMILTNGLNLEPTFFYGIVCLPDSKNETVKQLI